MRILGCTSWEIIPSTILDTPGLLRVPMLRAGWWAPFNHQGLAPLERSIAVLAVRAVLERFSAVPVGRTGCKSSREKDQIGPMRESGDIRLYSEASPCSIMGGQQLCIFGR